MRVSTIETGPLGSLPIDAVFVGYLTNPPYNHGRELRFLQQVSCQAGSLRTGSFHSARTATASRPSPHRLRGPRRPFPVVLLAADLVVAHTGENLARRRQGFGIDAPVGIPQIGTHDGTGAL